MKLLLSFFALTGLVDVARAQNTPNSFTYTYSYRQNGVTQTFSVLENGVITFPDTNAGTANTILFTVRNNFQADYALANVAISGSGFTAAVVNGSLPAGGAPASVNLTFSPIASTPSPSNGTFTFDLNGKTINFFVNAFVLKPNFNLSYIQPGTGNQLPLANGVTIGYPKTQLNGSTTVAFVIANTGTGSGSVTSATLSASSAFSFSNLPLTPADVKAGSDFGFGVTFTPTAATDYKTTLSVTVNGAVTMVTLDGQGASSQFSFETLDGSTGRPVEPGGTIVFPATAADGTSKSILSIQIQNTGNLAGVLSSIAITGGTDFQLGDVPVLPDTLQPSDIAIITVVFQPKAAGTSTARLQIGSALFNLTGQGLGGSLTLAVDVGAGSTPVADKSTVSLPYTTVGSKRSVFITVTNAGNLSTAVTGIGVTGAGFSIPTLPAIPVNLGPSQSLRFEVRYTPTAVDVVMGTVTVNNLSLILLGAGQNPPPLPQVSITNVPGVLNALQQPAAKVQIPSPYPYDVTGNLSLNFLSDSFANDPSIQFVTGGRTMGFSIPANTTQAIFHQAGGAAIGPSALFQTGTVSGVITLSAGSFFVGSVDITPATLPSASSQIPAGPPQLSGIRLNTISANQISLLISGYSTTRAVTQLAFQLTGAAGATLLTPSLSADVGSAFTNWYSNPSSMTFGSQFTVAVTLNVSGNSGSIATVAVTASNTQGASAAKSLALQ